MRNAHLMLAAAIVVAAASGPVAGAPCGFDDVDTSASFCPAVAWMKNRSITSGCTWWTFCPSQELDRRQAAAFLRRFGDALTPHSLHTHVVVFGPTLPAPPAATLLCATEDYRVLGFARRARFVGRVELFDFFVRPALTGILWVYSTDAGASWQPVGTPGADVFPTRLGSSIESAPANATALAPPMVLAAGLAYRFGMIGSGSGWDVTNVTCELDVTIEDGALP
jgi:hypothetical protein